MACMYVDGFDDVGAGDLTDYGWSGTGATLPSGRFAGNCLLLNTNTTLTKSVTGNTHFTVGFAWKAASQVGTIFEIREGSTDHARVAYNNNGTFTVSRAGTTVGATPTSADQHISVGAWYYLELDYVCDDSAGSYDLHCNAVSICSGSGVDTRNGGTGSMDTVALINPAVGGTSWSMDDMYINTGSTGFYGDCRVISNFPTGDGTNLDLTPSTGLTHWPNVDDPSPDDDSTYNYGGSSGLRDTYTFPTLGITGTVSAVQVCWNAKKTDAGTRSMGPVIRRSSTNYDGTGQTLTSSYSGFYQVYENDPSTSAAWTTAGVDAGEYGVKITA